MARSGSVAYSGAKDFICALTASTSSRMGPFTWLSKTDLRGRNQSRLLWHARPRKKSMAAGGKPGNPELTDALLYNWDDANDGRDAGASRRNSPFNHFHADSARPLHALRNRRPGGLVCRDGPGGS